MKSNSSLKQSVSQNNQAMMMLGGATAHSYRELGLSSPSRKSLVSEPLFPQTRQADKVIASGPDHPWSENGADLPRPDVAVPMVLNGYDTLLVTEEATAVSRFMPGDDVREASLNESGLPVNLSSDELGAFINSSRIPGDQGLELLPVDASNMTDMGFFLQDLLIQIRPEAQTTQGEFPETFDGSRQGALREIIIDLGTGAGEDVREFFQENIAGVARNSVVSLVDSADSPALSAASRPILQVDYYNMISEPVNSMADVIIQPIGSVSLPRLGPEFNRTLSELPSLSG